MPILDPVSLTSITFEFLGTLLIGVAVLRVHMRVRKEHRIDKKVLKSIRREQWLTQTGLLLIILGFVLNFV